MTDDSNDSAYDDSSSARQVSEGGTGGLNNGLTPRHLQSKLDNFRYFLSVPVSPGKWTNVPRLQGRPIRLSQRRAGARTTRPPAPPLPHHAKRETAPSTHHRKTPKRARYRHGHRNLGH